MVKKTIKYKDFNDQEREETFYFHLSKANLIELEARKRGGLRVFLERISQEQDTEKIWGFLSDIVLMSYGKKSDDGARHIKNAQLREEFESSEAYSELMVGLLGDPAGAAEFINGLIPHDLREQVMQMSPPPGPRPEASRGESTEWNVFEKTGGPEHVSTESMKQPEPGALSSQPAARVLTAVEIREMDPVDLQRGLVEGRYKLS
jgi:hypothetical protein